MRFGVQLHVEVSDENACLLFLGTCLFCFLLDILHNLAEMQNSSVIQFF